MTSAINPSNIDGAYPVAGQDNNSQGFRDNFTNTKTNFQYAADEISDLQAKVVLKAALVGTTLNNNMNGVILSNAQMQDMSETRVALGSLSGTVSINYENGSFQTLTTTGSVSLNLQNFPPAGALGTVTIQVTLASTAHTVTFPAAVSVNTAGIQGLNSSTGVMSFSAVGIYSFTLSSADGGATVAINQLNYQILPFSNSSEDLATGAASSLAKTTTYFSTAGAETGTLAAGADGQIKTFAMVATGGNMVITVTNAGWKGAGTGTMTFSAIGQACTLQYVANKWFCIGNNGVTFG